MSAKWKISQKKKTKPRTINRRLNADVQKNVKLALSLKRLANGVGFYSLPLFSFLFLSFPPPPPPPPPKKKVLHRGPKGRGKGNQAFFRGCSEESADIKKIFR